MASSALFRRISDTETQAAILRESDFELDVNFLLTSLKDFGECNTLLPSLVSIDSNISGDLMGANLQSAFNGCHLYNNVRLLPIFTDAGLFNQFIAGNFGVLEDGTQFSLKHFSIQAFRHDPKTINTWVHEKFVIAHAVQNFAYFLGFVYGKQFSGCFDFVHVWLTNGVASSLIWNPVYLLAVLNTCFKMCFYNLKNKDIQFFQDLRLANIPIDSPAGVASYLTDSLHTTIAKVAIELQSVYIQQLSALPSSSDASKQPLVLQKGKKHGILLDQSVDKVDHKKPKDSSIATTSGFVPNKVCRGFVLQSFGLTQTSSCKGTETCTYSHPKNLLSLSPEAVMKLVDKAGTAFSGAQKSKLQVIVQQREDNKQKKNNT